MKKELSIATILLLAVVSPVFAANEHSNAHAQNDSQNHGQVVSEEHKSVEPSVAEFKDDQVSPTVTVSPSVTPETTQTPTPSPEAKPKKHETESSDQSATCDPEGTWKNHGAYVSCVAKTHPGGQVVAAAAQSNIGKKDHDDSEKPSITPSITPIVTATPSPTPITSAGNDVQVGFLNWKFFTNTVARFFHSLPFFNKHA